MESSESSFSDLSSCSSDSSAIQDVPVAPSNMSFAVQRSDSEMKMIDEAVSSLINTLERYSHHLTDTQYAFYCRYGTDSLIGEMNRKARKAKKNGMDSTMMTMVDASTDVGSVRSSRPAPLHQVYPSNAPHNTRYARAPSTVSSVDTDYRRRPVFERYTQSGLSSGYSSGMPSFDHINRTGISNSVGALNPRKNEQANENRVSMAVPKHIKIFNWSLTLTGEELCVAGYSIDKSKITSGAVKKYSHPAVVTSKGSFLVIGQPCFGERTPDYIKSACSKGFPRQWRILTRKWIADRQARRKSTPKNTPERKNKHTASGKKKKPNVSASKATPNSASKEKPSKKNVGKKPQNLDESIGIPVAAKQDKTNVVKSRSTPDVPSKKKKQRDTSESEDESIAIPVAAKQNKTKMVKSRSNPDVSSKKKKQRDTSESEDESIAIPVAAKQNKTKMVKSRSNPDVSLKKQKQRDTPEDEDESIDIPVAAKQNKTKMVKSRSNPDVSLKKKKQRDTPEDERDGRSKKTVDIFGVDSDTGVTDAFSALGGDNLLSFPCSRSMTPNTLVANIQPDAGMIGRYTPPLQNVLNLFAANSRKPNSILGSPSSLNNSRDNPVSKRVAKVVEATKKGGKKKKKLPELGAPDELTDLVESLKSTNAQKTPTIVKKIFRNQRENDDDESDLDESMVY